MSETAQPPYVAQPQGQQKYLTAQQQQIIIAKGNPKIDNNVVKGYN